MRSEVIFSTSDFLTAVWRAKWKIFIAATCIALLVFGLKLKKPLTYTARGIFKTNASQQGVNEILASILGDSIFLNPSNELDPKMILSSQILMEEVVQDLDLQGELRRVKQGSLFKRIWNNLLTEYAYYYYGSKKRPAISYFPKKMLVADRQVIKEDQLPIKCCQIQYPQEIFTKLLLRVEDEVSYSVFDSMGQFVGKGELEVPFSWEGGTFTITKGGEFSSYSRDNYALTLLPQSQAALALKENLKIKRDKENASLLTLSYQGRDRYFGAMIVNRVMEKYYDHIKNESEEKTNEHLNYLNKRRDEITDTFLSSLDKEKTTLIDHIQTGGFATLEDETTFIAKTQGEYSHNLTILGGEMQRVDLALRKQRGELPKTYLSPEIIVQEVEKQHLSSFWEYEGLDLQGAKQQLIHLNSQLEDNSIQDAQYASFIAQIPNETFEISHIQTFLNDPSLHSLYQKTHNLQLALIDKNNWSTKEALRLEEDLETQKAYLITHLRSLRESGQARRSALRRDIERMLTYIRRLLVTEYEQTKGDLDRLVEKGAQLPNRWMNEQKILFETTLFTSLIESLAGITESKNLAHHLKPYDSRPLEYARTPSLPNPPKLRFQLVAGFLGGGLLSLFLTALLTVYRGPRATIANLKPLGHTCFKSEAREELALFIENCLNIKVIGITAKTKWRCPSVLAKHLEGVSILLIDNISSEKICAQLNPKARWTLLLSSAEIGSQAFAHLEQASDLLLCEIEDEKLEMILNYPFIKPYATIHYPLPPPKKELLFVRNWVRRLIPKVKKRVSHSFRTVTSGW